MKTTEIIEQVQQANTLQELSFVMDRAEKAVEACQCVYDLAGWFEVLRVVRARVFELRPAVIH